MSKIKTAVRILTGASAIAKTQPIKDPRFGPMLPGPEYDRYASLRAYQTALVALVHGLEGFEITKPEAIERIVALQANPHTETGSIKDYLRNLRHALEAPSSGLDLSAPAKVVQALARVREYLQPLDMGVSSLASCTPRPLDPHAPQRDPGQPLGSGLRNMQ
jgi:hypothetical protein